MKVWTPFHFVFRRRFLQVVQILVIGLLFLSLVPGFSQYPSAIALAASRSVIGISQSSSRSGPILYRYVIDNVRSRISFTFRGLLLPFDGHFGVLEGEIFLGPGGRFRRAHANVRIASGSVHTKDRVQLASLRNQVLEVNRYPQIELMVNDAKAEGDPILHRREREWYVRARGTLKMHGVEQSMPLQFRLTDTGAEIYVVGEGPLRLSQFNMSPPSVLLLVPGSDNVQVHVRLVAGPAPR